jgi:DNA modification methylase
MAHQSLECARLKQRTKQIITLQKLTGHKEKPSVVLLWLPSARKDTDAADSEGAFVQIASFCEQTHSESTICVLASSPDIARLLPHLEKSLRYQLWVAVKNSPSASKPTKAGQLLNKHTALLVMTRYRVSLRHTLTRIAYTYCPACGKTTKDYGGKKHTYNSYGTLMSDVWRDIECDPESDIGDIKSRLCDVFGISPYEHLDVLDLRACSDLQTAESTARVKEDTLPLFPSRKTPLIGNQLINEDCLTALKKLTANSIDFCFADPPYNIQKKYDHWNDSLEMQAYFSWCDQWLAELARVVKPGKTVAVINIPLWAVRHYQELCKTLNFQAWIVWDGLSLPVRMIMPSHYAIICFSKGEPRSLPGLDPAFLADDENKKKLPLEEFYCLRTACISTRNHGGISDRTEFSDLWYDIHRLKHNSRRVDHPCQLPPVLMQRLFTLFTLPGETVLDCFDGAGTTTLVAHQMERRYIGIELSAKYHQITKERHEMLERGEDPFGKNDNVPKSKNSRVERLTKQQYVVSKKTLQLEVREIARQLGRLPTRDEVKAMSKHPIEYFDSYFVSWGEVCAAARHGGMSEERPGSETGNKQATFNSFPS